MEKKKVIVYNGFSKHVLAEAAAELNKYHYLKLLITASYPSSLQKKIIKLFSLDKIHSIKRFYYRSVNIKDELVSSLVISDLISSGRLFNTSLSWSVCGFLNRWSS